MPQTNGFLLRPAQPVEFDVGRRVHPVDDDIFAAAGPKIRKEYAKMCGGGFEWVAIRSQGRGAFLPNSDYQMPVSTEKREWLRDLVVKLNDDAGFGGFWTGAWAHPTANHFIVLWADQDGDPHATNEDDRPFSRLYPIADYVAGADEAVREYCRRVGRLELAKWQYRGHA